MKNNLEREFFMNPNTNETEKKKKSFPLVPLFFVFLGAWTVFMISVFILFSNQMRDLTYKVDSLLELQAESEEQAGYFQENGFMIEGEYEIIDTSAISDAYLSGRSDGLDESDRETLEMASDILDQIIEEDMSTFEKEKAVYDWMYENIAMDSSASRAVITGSREDPSRPHGVLKSKNAVCVGYATTFRLFVNMLGLECHIPHNEFHSWDLVKLDDDCWYHVDLYYDITSETPYANFNMDDAACAEGHDYPASVLPQAVGTLYTAPSQFARELKSIYKIPEAIRDDTKEGKTSLFYSFKKNPSDDELNAVDYIMPPVEYALSDEKTTVSSSFTWYMQEDGNYVLGIYMTFFKDNYSFSGDTDNTSIRKMSDAYEKAFGRTVGEYEEYNSQQEEEEETGEDEVYYD